MGAFHEIDLFSEPDSARTAHLMVHRTAPVSRVTFRFIESPFGDLLIGETTDGLCWSAFFNDRSAALEEMQSTFAGAVVEEGTGGWLRLAQRIIMDPLGTRQSLSLHVPGSQFRLSVWRQLLDTPFGSVTTYGRIARKLGDANASRAVGAAVGANQIAYFIPCHRVLNADGTTGDFRWGAELKKTLIAFEAGRMMAKGDDGHLH